VPVRRVLIARTLGNDDMSCEEAAWANTVRSDSIPTNSTE
jgi:hypothetical protein